MSSIEQRRYLEITQHHPVVSGRLNSDLRRPGAGRSGHENANEGRNGSCVLS
jgi:hypothetical protein